VGELLNAALVAPAGKIGLEKGGDAGARHVLADQPRAERQHIGIIMLARQPRRKRLVDPRAAARRVAVDGDGDAEAGAAYGDPALSAAAWNLLSQLRAILRIVHALRTVGAEVSNFVAGFPQPAREFVFQLIPGMVGGKGDAHGL
jgi:hypothetical protein